MPDFHLHFQGHSRVDRISGSNDLMSLSYYIILNFLFDTLEAGARYNLVSSYLPNWSIILLFNGTDDLLGQCECILHNPQC